MRSRLLTSLALGAALWVVLVSAVGAVLSGFGWWSPVVAWPVAVVVAVASGWWARSVPGVRMPVAASGALVAVTLGFTVWVGATHSEQVLPRRDAASNLQAAVSLATTHERVVGIDAESVGGPAVLALDGVTLASPAFFQVGTPQEPAVQPQFVVGPAVVYGFGWWAGGGPAALVLPAVAMGLALLALGLLVARVVSAWAGVVSALGVGLLFPVVHTARATYSEPLAMLTLTGALLALTIAVAQSSDAVPGPVGAPGPGFVGDQSSQGRVLEGSLAWPDGAGRAALVAGVLLGGTGLVRIDALREAVLLLPVLALGAVLGARWVRPALVGLLTSLAVAAAAAVTLSSEYVAAIAGSLLPLVALAVVVGAASLVAVALRRRGVRMPLAPSMVRRLPDVAAAGVVVVGVALASRPLWLVVRQDASDPGARYVAGMQARLGLPIDGGRTYAEQSVAWLSWYLGPVALAVALVVLAVLVRRAVSSVALGRIEAWVPALVVAAGSTLLTLARPGITPDHPWADRRLLIALPLVVVLVVVAGQWLVERTAVAGAPAGRVWAGRLGAAVLGLLVVGPALVATWPHRAGGVERGSLSAVERVCDSLAPGDVVMAVDSRAANEWPQVVRGMCEVPTLSTTSFLRRDPLALRAVVDQVSAAVGERGGRLVLLGADSPDAGAGGAAQEPEVFSAVGLPAELVADVPVREDEHVLVTRPTGTDPLPVRVWLATAG